MPNNVIQAVDETIRQRRTLKVLADSPLGLSLDLAVVGEIISAAGFAPFHRPSASIHRGELNSLQPWRCYALDQPACVKLRQHLLDGGDDSKLPRMLAAARALILVTWLPNAPKTADELLFEPSLENMEHIAAASAATQNMLLAATARGIENYWSSGGALRDLPTFELLGIPAHEILLGAIFLFPAENDAQSAEFDTGKLRDKRGPQASWSKWVKL